MRTHNGIPISRFFIYLIRWYIPFQIQNRMPRPAATERRHRTRCVLNALCLSMDCNFDNGFFSHVDSSEAVVRK